MLLASKYVSISRRGVDYHIQHYSKLRKNVRVTQSQNVPSSSLSQPVADRQAEAGWRDKLGLGYARAFSAALNTADRVLCMQ